MKHKVVHLSSVHPAGDPRISVKECGALAAAGYDVVYVCPHAADDEVNGVRIRAVPKRRGRLARVALGVWDVWRAALRENADVYHLHDPELLMAGLMLRLTGAAVIYDVHEDLPLQILAKPWIPAPLRRIGSVLATGAEWVFARGMTGVVAATPQISRRFPQNRTITVQNFAIADELLVGNPTPYGKRPATFVYIGGLARIRGVFEMMAAAALVSRELGARLTLAGLLSHESFRDELAHANGWEQADYRGWLTRSEVARHLDGARAGLLLLHPTRNYLESYPVKAFEYMTAGLPVIMSDFPLWRDLFEEMRCAIFVDPLDPQAIATAMTWILRNPEEAERMGARGKAAALTRFNWQAEAAKLLSLYDSLPGRSNTRMMRAQFGDA